MKAPALRKMDRLGPLTIPLHGLHAMALSFGEDQFKRFGKCPPMFVLAFGTNIAWLEPEWSTVREKAHVFRFMRDFIADMDVRAYTFMSEVWAAARPIGEKRSDWPDSLEDLPASERDEKLMVDTWDREGNNFVSWYLITPRKRGLAFLGPRVDGTDEGSTRTGRGFNLFAPETEID
jgi:hypothetical protein